MSNENSSNRQPSHRAYVVVGDGDNATWLQVGAAWPTRNGEGFTISLDALPTSGRLVLMPPKERQESGTGGAR